MMKKTLLSITGLALTSMMFGQDVLIYGGGPLNKKDTVNSEVGFTPFEGTAPADFVGEEVTSETNTYLKLSGSSDGYYVWGMNNGTYNAEGNASPFGYKGDETGFMGLRLNGSGDVNKLKIAFIGSDNKTFSKEIDMADYLGTELQHTTFPLLDLAQEDANGSFLDPAVRPTLAQIQDFSQVNVILVVQSCSWNGTSCDLVVGTGEVWVDDIYFSETELETPPLAVVKTSNKAEYSAYPNPATSKATFSTELTNVTVLDATGNIVETSDKTTEINTSNYKAGIYLIKADQGTLKVSVK